MFLHELFQKDFPLKDKINYQLKNWSDDRVFKTCGVAIIVLSLLLLMAFPVSQFVWKK